MFALSFFKNFVYFFIKLLQIFLHCYFIFRQIIFELSLNLIRP